MSQALINPDLITWARERAGMSVPDLAAKLKVKDERFAQWEAGEGAPTFKQAQSLAHHTHIPFGFLFLHQPPQDALPLPDLRAPGSHQAGNASLELRDTIHDVMERQAWYRDYQLDNASGQPGIVGSVSSRIAPEQLANTMRQNLGISLPITRGEWESYISDLSQRIESLGVLVMRNSMVGNNTHRPLNVSEFRGFAIADPVAPVVFVNTNDAPGAQLFTLIHELAHIYLGESGISDAAPASHRQIEKLCNAVAAEFLVPADEFLSLWQTEEDWKENLAPLRAHFRVSDWVIARRALELNLIPLEEYQTFASERQEAYRRREKSGRPKYSRMLMNRVSKRLAQVVASEALSGRLLLRDAGHLLGIKPAKIREFAQKELAF